MDCTRRRQVEEYKGKVLVMTSWTKVSKEDSWPLNSENIIERSQKAGTWRLVLPTWGLPSDLSKGKGL